VRYSIAVAKTFETQKGKYLRIISSGNFSNGKDNSLVAICYFLRFLTKINTLNSRTLVMKGWSIVETITNFSQKTLTFTSSADLAVFRIRKNSFPWFNTGFSRYFSCNINENFVLKESENRLPLPYR
jgi:hypothetical protein